MKHSVVRVDWLESEAGWGTRPDGYSLHLTSEDADTYIQKYWDGMPNAVPAEYSRPIGQRIVSVDTETFNRIKKSKHKGIRFFS